jgi:hypothetical protein
MKPTHQKSAQAAPVSSISAIPPQQGRKTGPGAFFLLDFFKL